MRLTLNYLELNYEEELLVNDDEWFPTKFKRGIPFPNLPYIIDGDHK